MSSPRPLKVVVVGTRGIPAIQGGVETHCENLYPLLAERGVDVTVIRRKPYTEGAVDSTRGLKKWHGVKLIDIFTPRRKSLEAIVHTTLAIFRARTLNPDILHIHAVGPAIMAPLAVMLGMKVVMTNHGPDYERSKWGNLARKILRLGERLGSKSSKAIISISPLISSIIKSRYGKDSVLIPNGVNRPVLPRNADELIRQRGLEPRRYIVALGRFVPEKGFHLLINAYRKLRAEGVIPPDIKLAIAGDADHPDDYSEALRTSAESTDGVVLTGFIRGEELNALTGRAALFVMPSSHEGLPIALLEAMSFNLDVAVSDIPACQLPELEDTDFFPCGDTDAMAEMIADKLSTPFRPRPYDLSRYSWPKIADATLKVYQSVARK